MAWGPRNLRTFTKDMPKAMRRGALISCLAARAGEEHVAVLKEWKSDTPSTKAFAALSSKLPEHRKVLVIHSGNENLAKSSRNMRGVKALHVQVLNVADITSHDLILFENSALETANDILTRGRRITASTSAFQAEDGGSTPLARSNTSKKNEDA